MRPIGFSTGALAKGDFQRGIRLQRAFNSVNAIELSALRDHELPALVEAAADLDLRQFHYVSVHAPSKLETLNEETVFELIIELPTSWPIIVHPEIIKSPHLWQSLGARLCIENMDNRKSLGRTVKELSDLFDVFPRATFCLDVGHARQIDPTMATAILMLKQFADRLLQVHVSDVGPSGEHRAIGAMARLAFSRIRRFLSDTCPLVIESIISSDEMSTELRVVGGTFEAPMPVLGPEFLASLT